MGCARARRSLVVADAGLRAHPPQELLRPGLWLSVSRESAAAQIGADTVAFGLSEPGDVDHNTTAARGGFRGRRSGCSAGRSAFLWLAAGCGSRPGVVPAITTKTGGSGNAGG